MVVYIIVAKMGKAMTTRPFSGAGSFRRVTNPRKMGLMFSVLLVVYTVLRSVMTRTIDPVPAISTSFSCQLSSTLMACPPPSPPPLDCICENPPVAWGVIEDRPELGWDVCDIPLYLMDIG